MRRSEKQKVVSSREGMFSQAVSQLELPTAIATGFDMISILVFGIVFIHVNTHEYTPTRNLKYAKGNTSHTLPSIHSHARDV